MIDYPSYSTKYDTAFEKICAELDWSCARCSNPCEQMKCVIFRINKIITDRETTIRKLDVEELFEKKDDSQLSLFEE